MRACDAFESAQKKSWYGSPLPAIFDPGPAGLSQRTNRVRIRRDKEDPSWQPRNGIAVRTAPLAFSGRAPASGAPLARHAPRGTRVATEPFFGRRARASRAGAPSINGLSRPRASGRVWPAGAGGSSTASGRTVRRAIASHNARTAPRRSPLRRPLHTRLPGGSARRWGALASGGQGRRACTAPFFFALSRRAPATTAGSAHGPAR